MAGDAGDQEGEIERQLELQLEEQKESLLAVDEALVSDPSNPELLSVREELVSTIKDAEEGLLHLKHSRLLREADEIASRRGSESMIQDVEVEHLDLTQAEPLELEKYPVGSKCRFRRSDGRWYNGYVVGLENASLARISFLNPTSESMLMCKFFLQQRCRFGSNCRMSHGFEVPISSLKQYIPTLWQHSLVGSSIWAVSDGCPGIWREAELETWDDKLHLGQVVFRDGSSDKLDTEALSLSEYARMSGEEDEDESDSEASESSEEEEDSESGTVHQGIGFLEATTLQMGVQTETAIFAKWEHHTRGIASKMMVSMGYREGMGLGISGQGILDPISVKVLPAKQSLDHALQSDKINEGEGNRGRKRSRGGKRKREKKYAGAARAAKEEEGAESDVFSFINDQLAGPNVVNNSGNKQGRGSGLVEERMEDRRSLVAYDDKVKELRCQVEKLGEMVSRNQKDKVVYQAASRKLVETRKALADAEAAHASASNAVVSKEKEKRWLKF